jgi:hypothetical protein
VPKPLRDLHEMNTPQAHLDLDNVIVPVRYGVGVGRND